MKNFNKPERSPAQDWPKHLLAISDLSPARVREVLALAQQLKNTPEVYQNTLAGCHAVLLFEKPSLRTRLTFEIGMHSMGGSVTFLDCQRQKIGERESTKDMARNLERWCSIIIARTFAQSTLEELARYSSIPVINALSDFEHPCQALADVLTLLQRWSDMKHRKIVYVGDPNNVSNSLMQICAMLGVHFTLISPPGYAADPGCCRRAAQFAEQNGSTLELTQDLGHLFGADAVYTDSWISMGQEEHAEQKLRDFAQYKVTPQLMGRAGKKAFFMHCLPAHRGEEVSDSVIDGPRSLIYDQAENRLYIHKAVLLKALRRE
ncbi:MAG TPA: ornithine carbamoyltransferase [Acidobacteriota bacterium]|jgi:ornithine carbamoyltransferase|nr:ornithine carbamoyltransferase [Acidobacteriota bacterium]